MIAKSRHLLDEVTASVSGFSLRRCQNKVRDNPGSNRWWLSNVTHGNVAARNALRHISREVTKVVSSRQLTVKD